MFLYCSGWVSSEKLQQHVDGPGNVFHRYFFLLHLMSLVGFSCWRNRPFLGAGQWQRRYWMALYAGVEPILLQWVKLSTWDLFVYSILCTSTTDFAVAVQLVFFPPWVCLSLSLDCAWKVQIQDFGRGGPEWKIRSLILGRGVNS